MLIVFNRLAYNQKISMPLIGSLLLGLLEYYIKPSDIKSINIGLLYSHFSRLL